MYHRKWLYISLYHTKWLSILCGNIYLVTFSYSRILTITIYILPHSFSAVDAQELIRRTMCSLGNSRYSCRCWSYHRKESSHFWECRYWIQSPRRMLTLKWGTFENVTVESTTENDYVFSQISHLPENSNLIYHRKLLCIFCGNIYVVIVKVWLNENMTVYILPQRMDSHFVW